ncbi:MAG: AAA family ATPase, partial [Gammaproteobacteria bacterium]|nr:AAA family ATPase [Gammaproteobacteria bacterium]
MIYFERLSLRNWRNFKNAAVALRPRVFLIGPNSSGKSNLLDVFRFLRDISSKGLQQAIRIRGNLSSIRCLGATGYSKIDLEAVISDEEHHWRYILVLGQDNNSIPFVVKESVFHDDKEILTRPGDADRADRERLRQTALEQVSLNREFRPLASFFETVSYQHLVPQVIRDPAGFTATQVENDPFGRDFLMRVWKTGKKTRDSRLRKLHKALQAAVPQLEYLKAEQDEIGRPHLLAGWKNWRKEPTGQREDQFSDGTLRLLGLLWSCFEGTGPLLLEEPELSLHPAVIRELPKMFNRINRARKQDARQIIISTHSEELLSDPGIGPDEVLRLDPGEHETQILG